VVERLLPKQDIVGSSPITRSIWAKKTYNAVISLRYDGVYAPGTTAKYLLSFFLRDFTDAYTGLK
jgi:hypothetical protein